MPEVIVYGASDDLIYVECESQGIELEFGYISSEEQAILLVSSAGQIVVITPHLLGYWTALCSILSPGPRGKEVITTAIPRPDTEWKGYGDQGVKVTMSGAIHAYKIVPY